MRRVSFDKAARVFLDPLAMIYPDPDQSDEQGRKITIGHSTEHRTGNKFLALNSSRPTILAPQRCFSRAVVQRIVHSAQQLVDRGPAVAVDVEL